MFKVGIVGGTGYTGVELLRLLARHPDVEVSVITSRGQAGTPVAEMFPSLRGHLDIAFSEPELDSLKTCDVVFFATPHGAAMPMVPPLKCGPVPLGWKACTSSTRAARTAGCSPSGTRSASRASA